MFVTIITFTIILSILVFVHELGHFLVARFVGVTVEEFGLGLPPRIWGKKIKGTIYSINWLPIGGFVKLAGEDDEEQHSGVTQKNTKHLFWAKSKKERAAILLAGVTMNFLLALGITTYLLTQGIMEPSGIVHVENVLPGSPAETVGLKPKDIIESLSYQKPNGQKEVKKVALPADLITAAKTHAGEPITLAVRRGDQKLAMTLTPRKTFPKGQGPLGIAISEDLVSKQYSITEAPFAAFKITLERARDMLVALGDVLWRLVSLQTISSDVAGPIGIAQVTGQAVKYGLTAVLEFVSILSLNLAVINVLPFPALDGGRLAFVFLEKLFGKKFHPAFERSTHQIGMIILILLVLLISIHDIIRIASGVGLGG